MIEWVSRIAVGNHRSEANVADPIVGFPRPGFTRSGFFETQREARDALVAAWREEEAFRAEVRASPIFDSLGPYSRQYVTTGQPTPPGWSKAP